MKAAERRKKGEALSSSQGNIPEREREHAVLESKLSLGLGSHGAALLGSQRASSIQFLVAAYSKVNILL